MIQLPNKIQEVNTGYIIIYWNSDYQNTKYSKW